MHEKLEQLATEILAMNIVENLLENHERYNHAAKLKEYLDLCVELGVEPDPGVMSVYNEFLELYPTDQRQ
jgi:hypothetical protein